MPCYLAFENQGKIVNNDTMVNLYTTDFFHVSLSVKTSAWDSKNYTSNSFPFQPAGAFS